MVAKLIVVGDIHYKSSILKDIHIVWTEIVDFIIEQKPTVVAITGDVFDSHNVSDKQNTVSDIVTAFKEQLYRIPKSINVIIVEGNHDQAGPSHLGALHLLLDPLKESNNINIVTRESENLIVDIDSFSFICLPWYEQFEDIKKAFIKINSTQAKGTKIVLGHLLVFGSQNTNGITVEGPTAITTEALDTLGAELYCLGHIHKSQKFTTKRGKDIYYAGSICQLNFGESNSEPGVLVFEFDDSNNISKQYVHHTNGKRYNNINIQDVEELKEFNNSDHNHNQDYYKLKVLCNADDIKDSLEYKEATKDPNVILNFTKVKVVEREHQEMFTDYTPEGLLNKWCTINNIENIPIKRLNECKKMK